MRSLKAVYILKSVASLNHWQSVMEPLSATFYDAEEKTWLGPKQKEFYNTDITLGEVIYDVLRRNPLKIIQIHDQTGEKFTSKELLENSEALSRRLIKIGLQPGDIIGLYTNNWSHVSTVMLASFLCGTPVNALYPGFDKESVSYMYNVTKPKIIFCEMENYEIAKSVVEKLNLVAPIYLLNGDGESVPHIRELLEIDQESVEQKTFRFPCLDLKGDDTAMILCSSGTTGTPKGVLCSHRALLNKNIFLSLTSDSVTFTFSTMYWASGLWTLVSSLTQACLRIVTAQAFTPEYFLYLVKNYKITHIGTGGMHMAELAMYENNNNGVIEKSLESIDTLLVGGSKIPLTLQEKLIRLLGRNKKCPGFSIAYGMSELSGMVTLNGGFPTERMIGTEGKLVANCRIRIISKEGEPLGPMQHGEICIYTPYTWQGYFKNPEATQKALRNGWLYTGDIGYFNKEGFLHVCGRDNDVFKSRNFQIYPQLIEDVIVRIPGVQETCVFGIPDYVASYLTACVVVRRENKDGQQLTSKNVEDFVKANMGSMYHLSGGVYFVNAIPKTGSDKVQRHKVLENVMKIRGEARNENNVLK